MSKESVTINYESFENDEHALSDLTQAVQKLTVASDEQFNEIKEETWFKRLFNKLTFSKKNEKRIAEQIGNLAQAQSILLEILLRMSNQEQQVSQLVRNNIDFIRKLQENDNYLLELVKRLENLYVLGIKKSYDINALTENEKCILSGCLYYLAEQYEQPSVEQQVYANNVLAYIQSEAQLENLISGINRLKEQTRTEILCCCLEYIYLYESVSSIPEELNDFIDEFNLGNKTIRMIWEQITKTVKLRGIDGIIDKYTSNTFDLDFDEEFYIECDEAFLSESSISDADADLNNDDKEIWETYDNTPQKELVKIILNECIEEGIKNAKTFINKEIHVSSIITCRGSLTFINCNIIYGSENSSGQIVMEQGTNGATLEFINCNIICEKEPLHPFISVTEKNYITFQHCILNNLNNFIEADRRGVCISIIDTKFFNPSPLCIRSKTGMFSATNCLFEFNKKINIIPKNYNKAYYEPAIINFSFSDNPNGSVITNCTIRQTVFNEIPCMFSIHGAIIENCAFENTYMRKIVSHITRVENCKFYNCNSVCSSGENVVIKNSLFYNCGSDTYLDPVIHVEDNSIIDSCKFYKCSGTLIDLHTESIGGKIVNCDFIEVTLPEPKIASVNHGFICPSSDNHGLLNFSKHSGHASTVKNCSFNYIAANEGYLIKTGDCGKQKEHTVSIQNCKFNNCITLRNDSELIQTQNRYYTYLRNTPHLQPATEISDCTGLNNTINSNTFSSPIPDELSNSLEQLWNNMEIGCNELIIFNGREVNWDKIKRLICKQITEGEYYRWIDSSTLYSQTDDKICLKFPYPAVAYYVKANYDEVIKQALKKYTNRNLQVSYGYIEK